MELDDIIREYNKVVACFAAELASGAIEGDRLEKAERDYQLFKAGRDALVEQQERTRCNCLTKEQKCIAELWALLNRIENGARSHDLSLLRAPRGASGCDMHQGLPPICRLTDDILGRYEGIINTAITMEQMEKG